MRRIETALDTYFFIKFITKIGQNKEKIENFGQKWSKNDPRKRNNQWMYRKIIGDLQNMYFWVN